MQNNNDIWVAVPTYWSHASDTTGPEDIIFDHPTPLNEGGTLSRTLESFKVMKGSFNVIIVAAVAHPSLDNDVHEHVKKLLAPFKDDLNITLVSPSNLTAINEKLSKPLLSLTSYGNIRNVQLAVPYAMGAKVVIGIDDDELVEDPDFIKKVMDNIHTTENPTNIHGMAGPYYDRNGEYQIAGADELEDCPNLFIKKNYFMNTALKAAMKQGETKDVFPCNIAFGGNMCMSREMIANTCHDPYIPRGEDYDYVINAKMNGYTYSFQPKMSIVHLPPDSDGSQAADKLSKMTCDIKRFIYMKEKNSLFNKLNPDTPFDIDYIMPYPGPYLTEEADLVAHGEDALNTLYPDFNKTGNAKEFAQEASEIAREKVKEYFTVAKEWKEHIVSAENNPELIKLIEGANI